MIAKWSKNFVVLLKLFKMRKKILILFISIFYIASSEAQSVSHHRYHSKHATKKHMSKNKKSKHKKTSSIKHIKVQKLGYNTLSTYAVSEGLPANPTTNRNFSN